jgi:hypothetical protein
MSIRILSMRILTAITVLLAISGCAGTKKETTTAEGTATGLDLKGVGGERCDASKPGREISEYDSSGDGKPDVRKVLLSIGEGVDARKVMICREADIDGDGRKDVIRYYDDNGRSLREEADRDFDGKMDLAVIFQNGKIMRKEVDENGDGKVDTRIFFEKDLPLRAERDLLGRSTDTEWKPNRWEYYENGVMVRMGTDLDGDSRVDRWDRNAAAAAKAEEEEKAANAEEGKADTEVVED